MSISELFPIKIWHGRVHNFTGCQSDVKRAVADAEWDYHISKDIKTHKFARPEPFEGDVLLEYEMKNLMGEIQEAIKEYCGEGFMTETTYSLSWITKFDLGDYSRTHTHTRYNDAVRLSGIYYHQISEKNTLSFFDRMLVSSFEPDIEAGDLFLFPPDLPHCVNKTTVDEERIVLAFNIY